MELLIAVVVPGLLGGLVVALLAFWLQRRHEKRAASDPFTREPLSGDVINIAHIRVAGIGGAGLVAMAAIVAFTVPRIGLPIAVGAVFGVLLAVGLIAWRRRGGPMPSSGRNAGANTTLSIDAPAATDKSPEQTNGSSQHTVAVPAMRSRHA